jgi:DnaJ family protein C protein 11
VLNFLRFYRRARKELLEEKSNLHREIEDMSLLLRETARKHTLAEKNKEGMSRCLIVRLAESNQRCFEGLVVLEASYGPIDPDPEARDLVVDVTVAIQALVHKSQLYIPGHRSKVWWARFWALLLFLIIYYFAHTVGLTGVLRPSALVCQVPANTVYVRR